MSEEKETVEVHNVWTVYGMNSDGTEAEEPFACLQRPQDWGAPRWVYNLFRFDWITEEKHYINHCHCWTDLQMERHEYPGFFAPLITQIHMPGQRAELCGRDYLEEEDFWLDAWGEWPPIFEDEDRDWDDGGFNG